MIIRNFSSLLFLLLTKQSSAFAARSSSSPQILKRSQRIPFSSSSSVSKLGWIPTIRGGQNDKNYDSFSSQTVTSGGIVSASSTAAFATTATSVETSSPPPPPPPQPQEGIDTNTSLNIKDIVGNNIVPSKFGDNISYFDTNSMSEFRVLFVLGGPGAGKGTQSEKLKEEYPCVHLSVGDLLRSVDATSPHYTLVQDCLVGGKIVPVEISLSLLQSAMEDIAKEKGRSLLYLVDGFPRNYDNLNGWIRCMKDVASVWAVLNYQCPLEVLEQRILSRGEQGSGRSDDNIKSAQKRFRTFEEMTLPVVETIRSSQESILQVQDINGNRSIQDVWDDTQSIINTLLANDVWTANANLINAIETNNEEQYRTICAYMEQEEKENNEENKSTMKTHEGLSTNDAKINISNANIEFVTGTKATTTYDRTIIQEGKEGGNQEEVQVRETRVWSYEGIHGWRCIHFYRLPASSTASL